VVVLLAEEAESKSFSPIKKTKAAQKSESSIATNVLNQVQMQLESLQRKISGVNNDVGK